MYSFNNLIYTKEKSLARQCSIEMARIEFEVPMHVPLKILHKRKILTHYFHVQWGCAGTDRSAHVPLKSLTQEKNPYTLFPCSVGLCKGQIGVPMCP